MRKISLLASITFLLVSISIFGISYDEPIDEIHKIYKKGAEISPDDKKLKEKYDEYIFDLANEIRDDDWNKEVKKIKEKFSREYVENEYRQVLDVLFGILSQEKKGDFTPLLEYEDGKIYIVRGKGPVYGLKFVSVEKNNKDKIYKDLYLTTLIIQEEHEVILNILDRLKLKEAREKEKLWNEFDSVKEYQYPWEEIVNGVNHHIVKKDEEKEWVIDKPRELQLTLLHPEPIVEWNDDDLRGALGVELIGIRKFDEKSSYENSKGVSILLTANGDEKDDLGIGLIFNFNDMNAGIIYKENDEIDPNIWIVFGINIAKLTSDYSKDKTLQEFIDKYDSKVNSNSQN